MSKYAQRLAADEKAVKAEQITLAEANAKAQVEQEISGLKAQIATTTAAYNAALGANPFKVKEVFRLTAEKATLEQNLKIAEAVLSSEFSSN